MPEVAENELQILRNAYGTLVQMGNDPAAKAHLERALKVVKPDIVTEEETAERYAAPVMAEVAKVSTQLTEFLEAQKKREEEAAAAAATANVEAAFKRLEGQGYQPDGIEKIKQLMVDRSIADPEAAAALFDRMNPPQEHQQTGWTPQSWEIGSTAAPSADLKQLFENEDAWADREAGRVLNEIRVGQAA